MVRPIWLWKCIKMLELMIANCDGNKDRILSLDAYIWYDTCKQRLTIIHVSGFNTYFYDNHMIIAHAEDATYISRTFLDHIYISLDLNLSHSLLI